MSKGLTILTEDMGELNSMSPEECGLIIQNMIRTFKGEKTRKYEDRYVNLISNLMCEKVRKGLERSRVAQTNGKKGGAKVGNKNAKKKVK